MRKLLLSMLTTFLVIGLAGTGAFAYFSDTETSVGNTFTAGTLDLKVAHTDMVFGDGVTATWTMSNMEPRVTTVGPFFVLLQNSGSSAADHVEISFSHSIDEGPDLESDTNWASNPGDMARWIRITMIGYNGVNLMAALADANNNGFLDLDDLTWPVNADEGGPLDNLVPPYPNKVGIRLFFMALAFHAGATNDIQGDTLTTTVTFTLNQDSSQ